MSKSFNGIKLVLPAKSKNMLSCASGAKIYVVEEKSGNVVQELIGVVTFGIPETGPDSTLYITVTMPLLDVVYAEG